METTWCPARRLGFGRSAPVAECEGGAQSQGAVSPQRACVATSRPHPMAARRDSFALGRQSVVRVRPRRRLTASASKSLGNHASVGLHPRGVPSLAQQGHDLALALLPCDVDGSLAPLVSKSHIGAPFEKALGDREVAEVCREIQS